MRARSMIVALCVSGCARAQAPGVVVPPRQPPAAGATASERGDVELGLGVVTTAAAGLLLGLGSYEAWRAVQLRRYCQREPGFLDFSNFVYCTTPLGGNAVTARAVSSALSFAFAVPIAVGGGFLLRRGVVARRAWKAAQPLNNMSLRTWSDGQRGGGLLLDLRF